MPVSESAAAAYGRLHDIIVRLRAPDGCPWDREQTPRSIRGNLIEEAYECVEAIDEGDLPHVAEELGDVILVATMLSVIYGESGAFTTAAALDTVSDKLIRRHPHVFGDSSADTPDAVLKQWNEIKVNVEGRRKKDSVLDSVPKGMPPLELAYKLQKAAAKVGFDWPASDGAWDKLEEELRESRAACAAIEAKAAAKASSGGGSSTDAEAAGGGPDAGEPAAAIDDASSVDDSAERDLLEEELGDLLFSLVNVARKHRVDPALAMRRATEKFGRRFRHVERRMAESGEAMESGKLETMDRFWDEAKGMETRA